jgi:hypothetical protein
MGIQSFVPGEGDSIVGSETRAILLAKITARPQRENLAQGLATPFVEQRTPRSRNASRLGPSEKPTRWVCPDRRVRKNGWQFRH